LTNNIIYASIESIEALYIVENSYKINNIYMAYHRRFEKKFSQEPDKYVEVFSEFDFEYMYDGCDFFCPNCSRILECMTYSEIKSGWESFYM